MTTARILLRMALLAALAGFGCAKPSPVMVFVIAPAAGQQEITEEDKDTARATLEAVAAQYDMPRGKPGEANVIRYYQPTAQLQIGFFARNETSRLVVFAMPLMGPVAREKAYQEFRQVLEAALRKTFGGRLSVQAQ